SRAPSSSSTSVADGSRRRRALTARGRRADAVPDPDGLTPPRAAPTGAGSAADAVEHRDEPGRRGCERARQLHEEAERRRLERDPGRGAGARRVAETPVLGEHEAAREEQEEPDDRDHEEPDDPEQP